MTELYYNNRYGDKSGCCFENTACSIDRDVSIGSGLYCTAVQRHLSNIHLF